MIEHIQKIIIDYIEANNISNINNTDITIKPTKAYDSIYCKSIQIFRLQKLKKKNVYRISRKNNTENWECFESDNTDEIFEYVKRAMPKIIEIIEEHLKETSFIGCCHLYVECSDAGKCLKEDVYGKQCMYNKNLKAGRIFYGKNKNN